MKRLYKIIYDPFKTKYGIGKKFVRCVPNYGVNIYEFKATYSKRNPLSVYYVFGKTEKEALTRFQKSLSWLNIISIRAVLPGIESEAILTDSTKIPL